MPDDVYTERMNENFPVASVLLPAWSRAYVRAFYDFARRADDIADEGDVAPDIRRSCLDVLDRILDRQDAEDVSDAPAGFASAMASARVLRDMLGDANVSVEPARQLLKAFRQDTDKTRRQDWDDLMAYCRLSAVPVGDFLLHLLGGARDEGRSVAALTAALQVLNHVQDVRSDYLDRGRVYLPGDILADVGARVDDLGADRASGPVRAALDRTLDRVDRVLADAAGVACDIRSARLGLEAAVILRIARRLSCKLRGRDPLAERVRLNGLEYIWAILSGLVEGSALRLLGCGADDAVARSVHGAKSSFFWGMRLLPRTRRHALYAIYAFCRAVDDVADDTDRGAEDKNRELDRWQADIDALYRGEIQKIHAPLVRALIVPERQFALQKKDFLDVIAGMRTDANPYVRISDRAAFDQYCDRVAGAVGRLANPVFGIVGDDAEDLARHLGRAMQITNILRDVGEDAENNRLYLPADLLARHGVAAGMDLTVAGVQAVISNKSIDGVLNELADAAEADFAAAETILKRVRGRTAAPVRVMMGVYRRLLLRMRERGLLLSINGPRMRIGSMERLAIAFWYGVLHGR